MSQATANAPYDFRTPRRLADDIEHELSCWQASMTTLIKDRWDQQLGLRVDWNVGGIRTNRRARIAQQLEEGHACFAFKFEDRPGTMWCVLPRPYAIAMIGVVLGENSEEVPADRRLSDVELSVFDMAMNELGRVLGESQPCSEPLGCEYAGVRRPQELIREFSEQEPIVAAELQVVLPCGQGVMTWLLSQQAVLSFMTNLGECRKKQATGGASLENTVRHVPMQLVVKLGETRIHVSELLNLQPGDVIILDQRVSDPLRAEVCGRGVFQGWPGRIGSRQAFQIAGAIDHDA